MEFKIKQSVLAEALGAVQGALEKKTTIPVLSNVLIESIGEGNINITATDLDITIRRTVEADVIKAGAISVDARKLGDIVRSSPDIELHFEREDNAWVKMRAGKSKTRFAGVDRDKYPNTAANKTTPIKLSATFFSKLVAGTTFAVTNDATRFTLSGCKLEVENGCARMISTDGHRVCIREFEVADKSAKLSALIPKKALSEIAKITTGDISVGADKEHFFAESDGQIVIARLLMGSFPNYEMLIPKDVANTVECISGDLRAAIRRASFLSDGTNRSVRLNIAEGEIRVTAQSAGDGEVDEFVEADYSGEPIVLGFQWPYLMDVFGVGNSDARAVIGFEDEHKQALITFADDESFRYIIMPLRVH